MQGCLSPEEVIKVLAVATHRSVLLWWPLSTLLFRSKLFTFLYIYVFQLVFLAHLLCLLVPCLYTYFFWLKASYLGDVILLVYHVSTEFGRSSTTISALFWVFHSSIFSREQATTELAVSVCWSIRNLFLNLCEWFCITAPARPPEIVGPSIRPC